MKWWLSSLLIVLILCSNSQAIGDPFTVPELQEHESAKYSLAEVKETSLDPFSGKNEELTKKIDKGIITYNHAISKHNGKETIEFSMVRQLTDGLKTKTTILFEAKNILKPLSYFQITSDANGKIIRKYEAYFDNDAMNLPDDVYPREALPLILRSIHLKTGEKMGFHIWNMEEAVFAAIQAKVTKKEKIRVPAGEFMCYNVVLTPDIRPHIGEVLSPIAAKFLPKYSFWFTADKPHRFIKYEGPSGPISSPEIVTELIE